MLNLTSVEEILEKIRRFNRERVWRSIIRFIRQKIRESGAKYAVLGLSGGVDSSVTLKLTVDAIGPDRVYVLLMPHTKFTPKEDLEDSYSLLEMLKVKNYYEIPIDGVSEKIFEMFEKKGLSLNDVARGNILARSRMILLYSLANSVDGLVIGTGDKSEILIGYFTKYGDGGVDILPIGDLYKTRVREMAKFLGLPEKIAEKPSSPRLWTDHLAEKELGVTYEIIDSILYAYIDLRMSIRDIYSIDGLEREHVNLVLRRVFSTEHKRMTPPIPKLFGGPTVGLDWRKPHYYELDLR